VEAGAEGPYKEVKETMMMNDFGTV